MYTTEFLFVLYVFSYVCYVSLIANGFNNRAMPSQIRFALTVSVLVGELLY